ncbi:calcium-binding mitochondrial carrier protein SCaMC-2-B-like [Dysidea avara]|uniref:calcium-binding mitochondrial carrier protein SCaMC-2-B-like n=1 Tax=Dysidea avara TaxID=196820 RepID=UPI00331DC538
MDIVEVDTVAIPEEFSDEEKKTGMWWRQLLAGGGAGAVSRSCTAPLDRLKIFFQVQSIKGGERLTIMSGFRAMQEGGVRSLWRGNGVNVLKIAPESAIRFYAYEYFKRFFVSDDKPLNMYQRLATGASAGVVAQTSIYPMEVMKTRLALCSTGQYRGMADCMKSVVKSEGPLALYRGILPSLIGIIPYAGIDLAIYEA